MMEASGPEFEVIVVTSMPPPPADPQLNPPAGLPPAVGVFALSVGIKGLLEPRFAG